jgi:hypothetical protein
MNNGKLRDTDALAILREGIWEDSAVLRQAGHRSRR